ncbi:MAG: ribonuclease III [Deltaproteobacteria bacterium]|nr:ribonuclease III [Deltaproteobacteria bacterium]
MATDPDVAAIQERLGYAFRDDALLLSALTHTSYTNEVKPSVDHNERLEFLGDSVLAATVAAALFAEHPGAREGELTRMKAALVSEPALAEQARRLGLGDALRLGRGAATEDRAADTPSVLCAVFEAVVGAIFLDGGFDAAREFVLARIGPEVARIRNDVPDGDPKSVLQVACLKRARATPRYFVIQRDGPPHDPRFTVRVVLPDGTAFTGSGRSKKEAEQVAAAAAVEAMGL